MAENRNLGAISGGVGFTFWDVADLNRNLSSQDKWHITTAVGINRNSLVLAQGEQTIVDTSVNPSARVANKPILLVPFALTKPRSNTAYAVCDDVPLSATILGVDSGIIIKLEYWIKDQKIAESTDPNGWPASWHQPPAGVWVARTKDDIKSHKPFNKDAFSHTIVAKAFTSKGYFGNSAPVQIRVLPITANARNFIEQLEVNYKYLRKDMRPEWPKGSSGVTIGVGYDLGYNSAEQIRADWGGLLPDQIVERLVAVAGIKGAAAQSRLDSVRDVVVPWSATETVYFNSTLPRFASEMLDSYPQAERLDPNVTSMLLSLVFNRGGRLADSTDPKAPTRSHMRDIKAALERGDVASLPTIYRDMKHAWDGSKNRNGMYNRREDEASFLDKALRNHSDPCNLKP